MNYEQKYKDALERAKKWYYAPNADKMPTYANRIIKEIFPELKESEDEQSKKWILEYLHDGLRKTDEQFKGQFKTAIAWLEKQRNNSTSIDIDEMVMKYSQTKDGDFGLPVNCMIRAYRQGINDALNLSSCIEKQGEQKPAEYTLEQAAGIFLDALSNTPYNNKPITDAQVITKELLKFLEDTSSYNPNAINEQKPAWSEEEEKKQNYLIALLQNSTMNNPALRSVNEGLEEWLKSLKERVQPKQEWSEEDELHIRGLESLVRQEWAIAERENDKDKIYKMRDLSFFLKALKPQLKKELSEEEEQLSKIIISDVLRIRQKCGIGTEEWDIRSNALNWFKSLILRKQWKPTKQQLSELRCVISGCSFETSVLVELEKNLKKLL